MERFAASFREAGAGAGMVCVHSSASSSGQWRPLMERLADRFHVLAADLYGYGKSPRWPAGRGLTLADEVRLLEPVFRAAGDRFHLVGHSYGGAVALRAALTHPDRLRSLILFEPALFGVLMAEDPEQPAAREIAAVRDDTSAAVDRGALEASAERFVDYWTGEGAWAKTPEQRRSNVASAMPKVKDDWHAIFTEPTPLQTFSGLHVPTLFIVGAESPASSRGVARLLTGTLPRVITVMLGGVGHMGPVTHPEQINTAIEEFLQR